MYQNINFFDGLKYGEFVVYLNGGRNCLRQSAQRSYMQYAETEKTVNGQRQVEIYLNGKLIASAEDVNLKTCKAKAFEQALNMLQEQCYTIKPNDLQDTIKIYKSGDQVICGINKQIPPPSSIETEKKLDSNNKGYKMMKMMGWSGGGLGSKTQGREEPVSYLLKMNRAGLGSTSTDLDSNYFREILNNYVKSEDIRELHFESSFTKDERVILHELAARFQLKSSSRGSGDTRRLIISKKNISNEQILDEILIKRNPNYTDKYFVQVPKQKSTLFPEHTAKLQMEPDIIILPPA